MVAEKAEPTPVKADTNNVESKEAVKKSSEEKKPASSPVKKKASTGKPCPASKKPKESAEEEKPKEIEQEKTKVAEEAAPVKKEAGEDQVKPAEDVTLLLSAEEEAEVAAETNEDAVKEAPKEDKSSVNDAKKRKDSQKYIWVSNISRSTKATDLKKLFSEKDLNVDSAKVVTNGKSFFGYICLESPDVAQKSIKELNGITLNGKKIVVSLSRPDVRSTKAPEPARRASNQKKDFRASNGVKNGSAKKTTPKKTSDDKETAENGSDAGKDAIKDASGETKTETPEELELRRQRREQRHVRQINDLKTDLKRVTTELQNNRRRLTEATRRLDSERERKVAMRREIETLEAQLKTERRRHAQELEQLEKKRKVDEIRYQDDRAMLNRELDECRKIREFLQRKIDDFGVSRHSRGSPHSRPLDRSSDKLNRPRMESRGGRSPPPPPKINSRRSRDRSPPSSYKGIKKPRIDDGPSGKHLSYGSSHYSSQSSYSNSGSKPLLGHYPLSSSTGSSRGGNIYGSTSYPEPGRYGSSGSSSYPGSYPMSNPPSLLSRPLGYPGSSGAPRKY